MAAHLSLMHGWIPAILELLAVVTVLVAVARWRRGHRWIWVAVAVGAALSGATYLYVRSAGIAGEPAPSALWLWIGLSGVTAVAVIVGWRDDRWWRRVVSVSSVPLSLLCAAATVNIWVGYVPTVDAAWSALTAGPLPNQTDLATLATMQSAGVIPSKGSVVSVTIDSTASGFRHRDELVYLPPAWFATTPPPALPAVMMIGGEFNTPSDWLRAGNAIATLDAFAASHSGQAPVVVFVDSGGGFNVDTECVNGSRGPAEDHLTKDVVPYLIKKFGVSSAASNWAAVGFSAGGTCAVNLAVRHPELFGSFVDIAGDLRPNSGNTAQTIDRLFGGNRAAWESYDPSTVMTRHGRYSATSGLFVAVGTGTGTDGKVLPTRNPEYDAATQLCDLGTRQGIDCSIIAVAGKHDWPCAGVAFATSLPWLAARIGTPGSTPSTPTRAIG